MMSALQAHDPVFPRERKAAQFAPPRSTYKQGLNAPYFSAVINIEAGGLSLNKRRCIAELLGTIEGLAPERIQYVDGASLTRTLHNLAALRPDAVIVCGGDGTARTAIETLTPLGVATVPLPGGTLNRLVSAVFGHSRTDEIIARIAEGAPSFIPAGVVNGHRFFVVSGYGAPMRLNGVREHIRAGRWADAMGAWRSATKDMFGPSLQIGRFGLQVSCAIVALGPIDAAFGLRAPSSRGDFEAASVLWSGWSSALALAPFALMGGWRNCPRVVAGPARAVALQGLGEGIPALLDGEPFLLPREAVITYEDRAGLVWR
jgi:diacylglycerol kinase family enzyme